MLHDDARARVERAECDAFIQLYRAAAETTGTGQFDVDGIWTVWSPHDDDPGYSSVLNLSDAADPLESLRRIIPRAEGHGATVLGIERPPDLAEQLPDDALSELGFVADYQEYVWARAITPDESLPGAEDERVVRVSESDRDTFASVLNIGYEVAEDSVRGAIFASTIGLPGWYHYMVKYDGVPGSASVLYVTEGVAQLFVATTMPAYRGRGGQQALIHRRLADGRAAGCTIATSQTVVDNASPRNMGRNRFEQLYIRWIFGTRLR